MPIAFTLLSGATHDSPPLIDIDFTLVIQLILFLLLYLVLRSLVFKPYLAARQERTASIDGAQLEAERLSEQSELLLAQYESRVTQAKKEAAVTRVRLRQEGDAAAQAHIDEARQKAEQAIAAAKARVNKSVPAAALALRARADELARSVAAKVLGRKL